MNDLDIPDYNVVETYLKEALLLQGRLESLTTEKQVVIDKVEKAKIWLQKQPDYLKFLQHLQNLLNQKNIGAFSELLSYFVRDVLQKDKDIVLEAYISRGLPALKIEASNNGNRESILEGNGGSIANIVSTGLRLIALSRMSNRKFIMLDEPDCWLKPDHIPLFARIIGEISKKLNIQTVIISHHHWKYFKDYGRVIELKTDGVHLTTEIIHDTPIPENTPNDTIKTVILRRFMSHYETKYELHPHLTVIIGENDLGKSVITTAFKALSYADSSDSYIMHNENEAQTLLELNDNRVLMWQRFRETTQDNPQKVKFTFFKDGQKVTDAYSAHDVPDFIARELNISTLEDIDVHIGNQKQPVFLLSSDIKPSEKAKILSLGKESLIIQKMMENLKSKKSKNKHAVDDGQERYVIIQKEIAVLEDIETVVEVLEDLKTETFYLNKQSAQIEDLSNVLSILKPAQQISEIEPINNENISEPDLKPVDDLSQLIRTLTVTSLINDIDLIDNNISDIVLHDTTTITKIIDDLSVLEKISSINTIDNNIVDVDPSQMHNTKEISKAIVLISQLEKINVIEPIIYDIDQPELYNLDELSSIIKQLKEQQLIEAKFRKEQDRLEKLQEDLEKKVDDFIKKNGSLCPTCKQHVDREHILGLDHA